VRSDFTPYDYSILPARTVAPTPGAGGDRGLREDRFDRFLLRISRTNGDAAPFGAGRLMPVFQSFEKEVGHETT